MIAVVVSWDRALLVGRGSLGESLEIAGHLAFTLAETLQVTVDSYHGLEIYIFFCNLTKYLYYRGNLMIALVLPVDLLM